MSDEALTLWVRGLTISVALKSGGRATVVEDVSLNIPAGGTLGLVGESGSGKTMTSLAVMGLLPQTARVDAGEILVEGKDWLSLSEEELRKLRGSEVCMILQDPMTALDPSFSIGSQLSDPFRIHQNLRGEELESAMVSALEQVQLPEPRQRLRQFPHQLSGGMRQRVTSAIALAGEPAILIADEPTSALDVTTQARYLQLLRDLQEQTGFALLLIAHDLMVVRHVCERVAVMYAGQVIEEGPVAEVFTSPQHPYTRALLASIPVIGETVTLEAIDGQAPDPTERPEGCNFAARCKFATDICTEYAPELTERSPDRSARCFGTEAGGWIESDWMET